MRVPLKVTTSTAGEQAVTTSFRAVVDAERKYDTSIVQMLSGRARMESLYWLAWRSLRLSGVKVPRFTAWLDTVTDFEVVNDGEPGASGRGS